MIKISFIYVLFFIFFIFVVGTQSALPGIKTSVSLSAIHYFTQIGLPIVEEKLQNLDIAGIATDADTPIGHVNISVSDISVNHLKIADTNISLSPPNNLILAMMVTGVEIDLNWKYTVDHLPLLSDHGDANITIYQASIIIEITVGEENGKPTAATSECRVMFGMLDIKVHGGAGVVYQFIIDLLSKTIQDVVQKELTKQLPVIIDNSLSSVLSSLPIVEKLDDEVEINYELTQAPSVSSSHVSLSVLGEFYSVSNPKPAPYIAAPLPDSETDEMIQFFVSDFSVNSASYSFFSADMMQLYVNDSMLPATSPIRLNTTYFSVLIPPLQKAYPNEMFKLRLYAADTPTVSFSSSGADVNALVNVDFIILPSLDIAFTLQLKILGDGEAVVKGNNITGSVSFLNATLSIEKTNIGNFSLLSLQEIMGTVVEQFLVPQVNKKLNVGFPLPTIAGVTFNEPSIGWGPNYLYVSTDITYLPNISSYDNKPAANDRQTVHVKI